MQGPQRYRFGPFELDVRSGELRREHRLIRLQEQQFQALLLLIERAGELVTRDELRHRIWPDDTFVDFDHGLHSIVNRLRDVLRDSAESPLYIQTLPRRGYRFLAPVETVSQPTAEVRISPSGADSPPVVGAAVIAAEETAARAGPPAGSRARRVGEVMFRWSSIAALLVLLAGGAVLSRRVIGPGPPASAASARLAILPFDNLTGEEEQQFFVDGLHEELIFRLGRMRPQQLAVIARTSVLQYRQSPKTIADIARELKVDYVLEGSVRRAAPRVRITAQLIRGSDQSHVWTETYERSWTDALAMQKDIGARVADSLAVELLPTYQARMERDTSVNPAAYEHYLRGRFFWNQRTREPRQQLTRALGHFERALKEQPDYAEAFVGLADTYNSLAFSGAAPAEDAHASARAAIDRALQLDDQLPGALATQAWMKLNVERDWDAAQRSFTRALELDPHHALTRFRYSHLLAVRGRLGEAERQAQIARQVDPMSYQIAALLAFLAWYAEADQQALSYMREAADLEPSELRYRAFAAYVSSVRGDCESARRELEQLRTVSDEFPHTSEAAYALARCGKAPTVVEQLRKELVAQRQLFAATLIHLGRGELDEFYMWLDRAIEARSPEVIWLGVEPVYRPLRPDPRFQAALRRLNLG